LLHLYSSSSLTDLTSASAQRIGLLLVGFVGTIASLSPALSQALHIPHHSVGAEAFEKERAAFALGTWLMIPWTGVWLFHLFPASHTHKTA
jgi:hypothetical protein